MFRNNELPKKRITVNFLIADGGIGDLLSSLPAIEHTIKNSPWINLLVWVPNYMKDFAKHVLSPGAQIKNFTEAEKQYDKKHTARTTKWMGLHTPMRTPPVKYAFHQLCDYSPTDSECSYLKIKPELINVDKFNLPDKIVTIQAAYTERVKTMPAETFNKVVEFVLKMGYTPVFIGKTLNDLGTNNLQVVASIEKKYDLSKGINLINKTDLLESAAIINKSKVLVCMDGGMLHLGAFTDTPIVAGLTFVTPEHILPFRDGIQGKNIYCIEPDKSLECRGCQSKWNLIYNHDFRKCYYKDYKCVEQMSSDKFIEQLSKIL